MRDDDGQSTGIGDATLSLVFEHTRNGVAHCRMIFQGDEPVDFVYLHVNAAFAELTGLRDVCGTDAMPDGGRVEIATAEVELSLAEAQVLELPPGPYVELSVADSGCGMDEATRARIFEPFFTTKGPGKGTGLGLSTVYGIVRQCGGAVAVESSPAAGAKFRVYLARTEATEEAPTSPRAPASRELRGHETVLVVDDQEALGRVVARQLKHAGYGVIVARHGAQALELLETHEGPVALALLDVVMPDMNGRVLAERIAEIRPTTKILFMSGYTDETIERHGVLDGALLRKPFGRDAVIAAVRSALDV